MAGKRTATSELNHDNWEEYEAEEAGSFKRASEDVLRGRVIKTARRRNPISSETDNKASNAFSNFGGFGKTTSPAPANAFAFLKTSTANSTANSSNGLSSTTSITSTMSPANSSTFFKLPINNNTVSAAAPGADGQSAADKSASYYAKLKGLNESVSQWIKTHVDKNPFCILSPIFKDYEKHLREIEGEEDEHPARKSAVDKSAETPAETPVETPAETPARGSKTAQATSHTSSIFGKVAANAAETSFPAKSVAKPEETSADPVSSSTFSFGQSPSAAPPTAGFSFGSGASFAFANVAKPPAPDDKKPDEAEEEDEPPKVEFKPVVEDGSVFSKRCKVYVKKDGVFGDRGVGQLFLKPVAGGEKMQLIVRANTNLGNLLLNFILSEAIPTQRTGKNNVMLVCIPTPDAKPPPTPVLLRVKTAEEADELLAVLQQHKK